MISPTDYQQLQQEFQQQNVLLVAVSKFQTIEKIEALYALGQRDFGENYVQELLAKYEYFKDKPAFKDIRWHFIGHLQRNKVKYIAPFVYMIHSVDSYKLLAEINKEAAKHGTTVRCLLQLFIANEETKHGLSTTECLELLEQYEANKHTMQHVSIVGMMGMASFVEDPSQIRDEFKQLKANFKHFKSRFFLLDADFKELSMGMSSDYAIAIEEGSTLVRIGSLLFGKRA